MKSDRTPQSPPSERAPAPARRTNWQRTRRDLLRQLGIGAAWLPLLHATRARAARPKRLICVALTHGYERAGFQPAPGALAAQTLPTTSLPLEPFKDDLIFLPDLTNPAYPADRTGHGSFCTMFYALPSVAGAGEYRQPVRSTVDQVVAAAITPITARSSLALQVQVDAPLIGSSSIVQRRCFWNQGAPVTPEADPFTTYHSLFSSAAPEPVARRLLMEEKSVLDYVGRGLERFSRRVGREDQPIIAAHMQAVRDTERELIGITVGTCAGSPPTPLDHEAAENYEQVLDAQMNLMLAALRCGVTRVATLQLSDATGQSARLGSFIGATPVGRNPTWFDVAHPPAGFGFADKVVMDKWAVNQMASLLARLKGTPDLEGNLLDNSAVLFANNMEDAASHNSQKAPFLLAGRCGGYFKTGQAAASAGQPIGAVLSEICRAFDVTGDPFGPPLPLLRA